MLLKLLRARTSSTLDGLCWFSKVLAEFERKERQGKRYPGSNAPLFHNQQTFNLSNLSPPCLPFFFYGESPLVKFPNLDLVTCGRKQFQKNHFPYASSL